jgi:primosomal protein N'
MHYYGVLVDEWAALPYTYAHPDRLRPGTRVKVPSRSGERLIDGTVVKEEASYKGPVSALKVIEEVVPPLATFTTEELEAELAYRRDSVQAAWFGVSVGTYLDIKSNVLAEVAA